MLEPTVTRLGVSVAHTRVSLAFATAPALYAGSARPPQQPVFAYLPLRSYGLRFVAQVRADHVPAQRQLRLHPMKPGCINMFTLPEPGTQGLPDALT